MAWAYKGTVTITGSSTLLPSTQTNFPVLVKLDSVNCTVGGVNRIKTTANGGAVQNTGTQSGGNAVTMPFDLVFYSDSGLSTKVPWEVDSYDGTGGTLWVWVLMASCALSGNLYFGLGDAAVNTQQNTSGNAPSAVWDANHKAVWHLPDGTTLSGTDSTSNAKNLTINGSWGAAAGQIDGGTAKSNATSQYLNNAAITTPASITISFWNEVLTGDAKIETLFCFGRTLSPSNRLILHAPFNDNTVYWDFGNSTASDGRVSTSYAGFYDAWTHVTATYDSGSGKHAIYLNGVQKVTNTHSNGNPTLTGLDINADIVDLIYGKRQLDEIRISDVARGADWITADYNNGLAPQTFAAVSLAVNTGGSSGLFRPSTLSGLGAGGSFFQNPLG